MVDHLNKMRIGLRIDKGAEVEAKARSVHCVAILIRSLEDLWEVDCQLILEKGIRGA